MIIMIGKLFPILRHYYTASKSRLIAELGKYTNSCRDIITIGPNLSVFKEKGFDVEFQSNSCNFTLTKHNPATKTTLKITVTPEPRVILSKSLLQELEKTTSGELQDSLRLMQEESDDDPEPIQFQITIETPRQANISECFTSSKDYIVKNTFVTETPLKVSLISRGNHVENRGPRLLTQKKKKMQEIIAAYLRAAGVENSLVRAIENLVAERQKDIEKQWFENVRSFINQ